jgi:hypothetical protein
LSRSGVVLIAVSEPVAAFALKLSARTAIAAGIARDAGAAPHPPPSNAKFTASDSPAWSGTVCVNAM